MGCPNELPVGNVLVPHLQIVLLKNDRKFYGESCSRKPIEVARLMMLGSNILPPTVKVHVMLCHITCPTLLNKLTLP